MLGPHRRGRLWARRPAFTLLEVLLSTSIGVLLLAALYVAVDVQLHQTQAAREVVEQASLVRALLTRISLDVSPATAAPMPALNSSASGSTGGSTGGTAGAGTTGNASGTGTGGAGTTGGGTSGQSTTPTQTTVTDAPSILLGVQGDSTRLIVSVSRVPPDPILDLENPQPQMVVSDVRRIAYWLAGGGDNPLGLARQEITLANSDEAALVPPDIPEEQRYVIAEEVRTLAFSYFDGQSWLDSWDGTTPGSDGRTPIGPPLAVAVIVGVAPPGALERPAQELRLKYYRHVIAIPTANGATQATTTTP